MVEGDALAHAAQTVAATGYRASCVLSRGRGNRVVLNPQLQTVLTPVNSDGGCRAGGVFECVGERLLHGTVGRKFCTLR